MSARSSRFSGFGSRRRRGKAAGAVIACAALLLAGCGGSDAAVAGAPVIRGDVGDTCEPATGSWTATAAVGGVTRTVIFTAPTHTSPWTKFTATANTGQSAEITSSSSSGSIQLRGLTKKANNTFIVTGTTADGCTYTSPPSITVSGAVEAVVAPGVPTIATVTAGDAKATVTVAAATTGGTPASYTVTASPAVTGGTCTVTGESGSCDVTGLTNGTAYTFTAAATNTGGTSGASGASASVTPLTVPGAPVIGAVAAAGSTSATVAFTAPASNGGSAITIYTATSNTGANAGTASQSGSGTITVVGLTANTPYTFTVTATNTKGTSAPSDASTSVTLVTAPAAPATPTVVAGASKVTVAVAAGTSGGTPVSYTVTAYAAGKATGGTCTVTGVSVSCDVTGLTSGTAYTFKATATNTKGTSAASGASVPVTLVAVSGPQFKVEYVDDWQVLSPLRVPARQWVARGSSVTIAANVATPCPDYCWGFAGWSPLTDDSGPVYSPGDVITPTANMKLYAQWFPMITYDPNGGLGTMPTKAIREGGRMEAPTFTNGNLLFVGWNTKADGSGKLYNTGTTNDQPGSTFADTTVTKMTMYAQWRTQLRVSFDANDGRGIVKEATVNYPTQKFYPTNYSNLPTVTREGYRFTDWCVDPFPVFGDWCRDGLDDGSVFFNLQEDVRLFARWEKN